ncbi:potassium channel family protein [Nocardioides sp.]|uniref:potassium channel family protein n=1 Tax=Nocardioides sp. TaxID=35761 RepID=UPI00286A9E68|nr:potassium channel family protein [Nocardioides sp.]
MSRLATIRDHPSGVLLVAQFFAVLSYPFLDDSAVGRGVVGVVQMGVVGLALWAVRRTPALSWMAVLLGGPALVFTVLEAAQPSTGWIVLVSALFHAPFYFYISYGMIRYLFHDDSVTRDELFATGAAFTVVAWGFAYVYAAAQVVWPGSFAGSEGSGEQAWFELLYLSFTTLTSVGLSDIVPVLDHARSLVMLEQVAGVFYVALVVARLVGLNAIRHARPNDGHDGHDGGAAQATSKM